METSSATAPTLRRTLSLWDLILYGIIVIQPTAPMSIFGVLSERGRGHVVTAILIAMVAMLRRCAAGNGRSPSWSRRPTGYTLPVTR